MHNQIKQLGILLALNGEAVGMTIAGYLAGQWLNEKYPKDFSWTLLTMLLALACVVYTWTVVLKKLFREDETKK